MQGHPNQKGKYKKETRDKKHHYGGVCARKTPPVQREAANVQIFNRFNVLETHELKRKEREETNFNENQYEANRNRTYNIARNHKDHGESLKKRKDGKVEQGRKKGPIDLEPLASKRVNQRMDALDECGCVCACIDRVRHMIADYHSCTFA